jgi:predicted DNA-binding protein (UPF0251 family)
MVRPQKNRFVKFDPDISYFKPRGIPMQNLEEVRLTVDEGEAIRLADLLGLSHEEAGRRMGVSRATFGRIVQKARKTVADALINGKAINIEGGNYKIIMEARIFKCLKCHKTWEEPKGTGRPKNCPICKHDDIHRTVEDEENGG